MRVLENPDAPSPLTLTQPQPCEPLFVVVGALPLASLLQLLPCRFAAIFATSILSFCQQPTDRNWNNLLHWPD